MTIAVNAYHEHEQQQHQQKQHGFCDVGRCKGPTFELDSGGPVNAVVNGPPCVPEPMPRSRHPGGSSDTLQDILELKIIYISIAKKRKKRNMNVQKKVDVFLQLLYEACV